ncbi:MAG: hypothetical protein JO057_22935, partial [Chloroflexi bacterium]|nr:hypothetical protein [Chloroflexota bacterium]
PGVVQALGGSVQAERLPAAVRALPGSDRAPLWELAIRHYARGKPVDQAAAEIGMDPLHAHALLAAFRTALLEI